MAFEITCYPVEIWAQEADVRWNGDEGLVAVEDDGGGEARRAATADDNAGEFSVGLREGGVDAAGDGTVVCAVI